MKVSEFAKQIQRETRVIPDESYRLLGLRLEGRGLFHRETKRGADSSAKYLYQVKEGDFVFSRLFAWRGAFAIVNKELDGCFVSNEFPTFIIDKSKALPELFLKEMLKTKTLAIVEELCSGTTKLSRNRFKEARFLNLEINLPDIKEQAEFNCKLDRVENLKRQFKALSEANKELINKLKQAILQAAVMGKLVPQDPNDEPATELLKRIKAEKELLIKAGKLKKQKPLPPITPEEIPYDLPPGWAWCRLGEVVKQMNYGTSIKLTSVMSSSSEGIPVLRMNNIVNGEIAYANLKYIQNDRLDESLILNDKDILFNRTNSYELVGKTALYNGQMRPHSFASYLIRISVFADYVLPEYISFYMNTTIFREMIEKDTTQQNGQANFNGTKLQHQLVPLTSTQNQEKICNKLNAVTSQINAMKTSDADTKNTLMGLLVWD